MHAPGVRAGGGSNDGTEEGIIEELLRWLQESEGPLAYLVLALAGAIEYVLPPFPGDTVTLFSTVLAGSAGYGLGLVYVCLTVGAIAGSLIAYAFGGWIGRHEERWPRFLRTPRNVGRIEALLERFRRHGAAYLAINRFLPAFRSLFFVTAGMAGLPVWKVVVFGGLSAAAWNLLIIAVGWAVGNNFDALRDIYDQYTFWSLAAVAALVCALVARHLWRSRAR